MRKMMSISLCLLLSIGAIVGNCYAQGVSDEIIEEKITNYSSNMTCIAELEWGKTLEEAEEILGEAMGELSDEEITLLKYDGIETVFGTLDNVELLFLQDVSSRNEDYYLYTVRLFLEDSIEDVSQILEDMYGIKLQENIEEETIEETAKKSVLSKEAWKLENIPAATYIDILEYAEDTSWIELSLNDFYMSVCLTKNDDCTQVEFQALPYVIEALLNKKEISDMPIDISDEKWQPMIGNLEWGDPFEQVSESFDMTEIESDKEGCAKYQLKDTQILLDQEMVVCLYFNTQYDLGLVGVYAEFEKNTYNDALEEIYDMYGTAAQSHISASIGTVYSTAELVSALDLLNFTNEKTQEEIFELVKLYSARALSVVTISNSEKNEKAIFSIVADNMALLEHAVN